MAPVVVIDLTSSPEPEPEPDKHLQLATVLGVSPLRKVQAVSSTSIGAQPLAYDSQVSRHPGIADDRRLTQAISFDQVSHEDEGYHSYPDPSRAKAATDQNGLKQAQLLARQGGRKVQLASTASLHTPSNEIPKLVVPAESLEALNPRLPYNSNFAVTGRLPLDKQGQPRTLVTTPGDYYRQLQKSESKGLSELEDAVASRSTVSPQVSSRFANRGYTIAGTSDTVPKRRRRRSSATSNANHERLTKRSRLEELPQPDCSSRRTKLNDVTHLFEEERLCLSDKDDSSDIGQGGASSQPEPSEDLSGGPNMNRERWTAAEDALLIRLRSDKRLDWAEIVARFNGRTPGALQVRRADLHTSPRTFPSALKWGEHPYYSDLLLGGYSADEEKSHAGETCLWNVTTGQLTFSPITRNVFDIAWNPNASSASIAFAVASNATGCDVGKGMQTVIQCFSPGQHGWQRPVTWQCPARDINDVVFCPHDDNLLAAGATDGKVYVWDKRWADRSQKPLHVLAHGESLNVLNHDQAREVSDTGVRFLSWGSTRTRLYTGSSDGIVKAWNPYRSVDNALVEDISAPRQHRSAIMSGAFSPDYRDLLIGTEDGRINLFETDAGPSPAQPFKFCKASAPEEVREPAFAAARSVLSSGAIELRPCGAMPMRQAVQGPNYEGPFLRPTAEEFIKADKRYVAALDAQNAAFSLNAQRSIGSSGESDEEEASKSEARVREAQSVIETLQQRSDHFEKSAPKAIAFQRSLRQAEADRVHLLESFGQVEPCKLDCAVLPTGDDDDLEVEDSRRSELRIPGYLRWSQAGFQTADAEDASSACPRCNPLRSVRNAPGCKPKSSLCGGCLLKQAQLTSMCSKCSAPARIVTDAGSAPVCESCAFACFRCGHPAKVSANASIIECADCGLMWEARTLGYELLNGKLASQVEKTSELDSHQDELGDDEREYYASRWKEQKSR